MGIARLETAAATEARMAGLRAGDPAAAPEDLYADYLRQILQSDYTDRITEFVLDLNTHCHGYRAREGRAAKDATLARLIAEEILTTEDGQCFGTNRSALPADERNLYQGLRQHPCDKLL
jgi:hypothetical protein